MSRLGINTGSTPNDGTGDTLLAGAVKINSNFQEVYNVLGDGTNAFVGIVTQMVAGSNISITTSFGSVTVAVTGLSTANINADSIVVTGVSTLGIVTGATYFGDGSNLTGIAVTNNISSNSLVVSGVSTLGVVTGATYFGDGSNLTGVSTANIRADSIVVTGVSTLGVVTGATYFGDGSNLTGIAVTNNISSNSLVVSGVSTLGVVTGATYFGDGSNLTGVGGGSTANISADQINVSGVSTFVGVATFQGDVNIGQSPFNTLTINADIGSNLDPDGNGTRFIGADGNRWSNIYAVGLDVSGTVSAAGTIGASAFYGDGSNLTGISAGSTAEVRANTLVVTGVSTLGVVTGATYYGDASYIVSGRWTLGADGTNNYEFTGIGFTVTTNDPILYLARGVVYEFENTMGAHPFEIRESENGNAYNNGVTNNAVSNGVLRFEIPFNAPNTLYYQCTSHASMGNTISVYPSLI